MPIEFHCPHCDKLLRTPDNKAGVRANCPGCGQLVTVPQVSSPDDQHESGQTFVDIDDDSTVEDRADRRSSTRRKDDCPHCGESAPGSGKRCRHCGELLNQGRQSSSHLKAHRGTVILIFGILSWVCCFPFGIAAWVMANQDLNEMDSGAMDPEGRGLTMAGKIVGIVSIVLNLLGIVSYIVIAALAMVNQM